MHVAEAVHLRCLELVSTGFVIQADSINSLLYQNVYYGAPVRVIPTPDPAATKVLVPYNLRTGFVAGVAPVGKMSFKSAKKGSGTSYSGDFRAFYNERGVNIAPHGASTISVDSTGKVLGIR